MYNPSRPVTSLGCGNLAVYGKLSLLVRLLVLVACINITRAKAQSVEFLLEVQNKFPAPQLPSQYIAHPDGEIANTNDMSYTIERYYCRKSPVGFLVEEVGTNLASMSGTITNLSGDKIIANFQNQYLFKASKDSPLQYSADITLMTNEFKNGFAFFKQQALDVFAMTTGLGLGNSFQDTNNKSRDGDTFHLELKADPTVECAGRLITSNNIPAVLDITFTNKLGDLMGYHYEYEGPNTFEGSSFTKIHLTVTNLSNKTFRFDRTVHLIAFRSDVDFSAPSDFAFSAVSSNTNATWLWEGDKIKGMDQKLVFVAKNGVINGVLNTKGILFARIVLICCILLPPVIWTFLRKTNKQKN